MFQLLATFSLSHFWVFGSKEAAKEYGRNWFNKNKSSSAKLSGDKINFIFDELVVASGIIISDIIKANF